MSTFVPGIPGPGEYAPFFAGYVAKSQDCADPVQKLDEQMSEFLALLEDVAEEKQLHRYAPGKWSVKDVVGHLIDAERIFAYRALRIARGDQTPLPGFDENNYVPAAEADRFDWQTLLEEFIIVRRSTILMLSRLPDEAWTRSGTASNNPTSVRALLYIMIGHVAHHLDILRERYL
jgi:uncharacterized damage-inducible protein DinB